MRMALMIVMAAVFAGGCGRPAGPRIAIDEPRWDFGAVSSTGEVAHTWTVRNAGSEPLEILQTAAECGCAAVTRGADTLEPGEATSVAVQFKLGGRKGRIEKLVRVVSTDPQTPVAYLVMRGEGIVEGK